MRIQRVRSTDEMRFAGLAHVYAACLPASERKSTMSLRAMLARPQYLFLAATQEDRVVGFAIAIALANSDAALLEYMAVDAQSRGRGIGTALFRGIVEWPEIADRFLLVEVDSDREESATQDEHARRKAFYRRTGARELEGVCYRMPPVTATAPPPMELMAYRRELPASIEKERVRRWVEACHAQVYGMAAADSRIGQMLAGCAERIRLV